MHRQGIAKGEFVNVLSVSPIKSIFVASEEFFWHLGLEIHIPQFIERLHVDVVFAAETVVYR